MNIHELRAKRAEKWEAAKAFLDARRRESGLLSAEDDAVYTRMEEEITALGKEISRLERRELLDTELAKPVSSPITEKPDMQGKEDVGKGRAADAYKKAFWARLRAKEGVVPELRDALQVGTDAEGGYLVPDEFEHTLLQGLNSACIIRKYAHCITTSNGLHKIPVVPSHGTASWMDEEGAYQESDEVFGQVNLDAHKVGTLIKVSEELLQDSAFDLEGYLYSEFVRRIGAAEESAFLTGNGSSKPTGLLHTTGGAEIGVNAAGAAAVTADELIDLFYSLKSQYRENAVWILNDSTVKAIRKLKKGDGEYLWQPAIKDGQVNTILGRPYFTASAMPEMTAESKPVLFGDLNYYWIGDRQGIGFKRLNELYAGSGQVGFLASKRLDGKLVLPEAVKVLKMHA